MLMSTATPANQCMMRCALLFRCWRLTYATILKKTEGGCQTLGFEHLRFHGHLNIAHTHQTCQVPKRIKKLPHSMVWPNHIYCNGHFSIEFFGLFGLRPQQANL